MQVVSLKNHGIWRLNNYRFAAVGLTTYLDQEKFTCDLFRKEGDELDKCWPGRRGFAITCIGREISETFTGGELVKGDIKNKLSYIGM